MQDRQVYVAYQEEEKFWEKNAKKLKEQYPNMWLVISGNQMVIAVEDYLEAAKVLDSWPQIAIVQPTGEQEAIVSMPHIQAATIE